MSSKILVIGRTGQLAHELRRAAWPADFAVDFIERPELDLAQPRELHDFVIAMRPHIVVNAAGASRLTVNVISGSLSVYGASKAEADAAIRARLDRHVIVRTSWLYSPVGHNFVKTMLRLGAERDRLGIVDDQRGSPTASADIAKAAIAICAALGNGCEDGFGTFHFCGGGVTSWYGFAQEIFAGAAARGLKTPRIVEAIPTEAYPTPAPRPRNSALDCRKIARVYGIAAPPWRESLAVCLDEIVAAMQPAVADGML